MQPSGSGPVLHGISLEQYAGVLAALGERIPLAEVLRQEEVDAGVWPKAERAWREAIVDAPDLQIALLQKRRIAEDCLARSIEPIDGDPAAWVGLLSAIATSADANALLDGFGLTTGDVARIGRAWRRKAEADPKLGKELADLAPSAAPPTKVTAGPVAIRRFPWSPRPRASEQRQGRYEAPDPSVVSAIDLPTDGPKRQLASYQLREQEPVRAPVPALPPALLVASPSAPPATPQPTVAALGDSTAIAPLIIPAGPAVPFEAAPSATKPAVRQEALEAKGGASHTAGGAERRELTLDQYAWVVATVRRAKPSERGSALERLRMTEASYADVNRRWDAKIEAEPALGQAFAVALVRQMAALKPAEEAPKPPPQPIGDETAAVDVASIRAAIPFLAGNPAPAQQPKPAAAPPPAPGTVFLSDDEIFAKKGPQLPFAAADPHAPRPAPARSIPIVEAPRSPGDPDATISPSADAGRAPATPFKGREDELMPLAQYASISAVLIREGNPDATFRRLGIDPVAWLKTVRAYAKRFGEDRALSQEFERLMQNSSKAPR